MKSRLFLVILVVGFALISGSVFAKEPMKLDFSLQNVGQVKIGGRLVTTHSLAAMAAIESELEKRMGGTVDMVIHPGATLGNVTECMEQAKLGVIAGALATSAYLAKFTAETHAASSSLSWQDRGQWRGSLKWKGSPRLSPTSYSLLARISRSYSS